MTFKGPFQPKLFYDSMEKKSISLDRSIYSSASQLSGQCWETGDGAVQESEHISINTLNYKQGSGDKKGMQCFLE